MTPTEAISYFGTQAKLAERMGIAQSSVSDWLRRGHIPWVRQFQLERITNGALMPDPVPDVPTKEPKRDEVAA